MVRTAVMTHAMSIQPGLSIMRDMSAETMKIPDPIMMPMVIITGVEEIEATDESLVRFEGTGWLAHRDLFFSMPFREEGSDSRQDRSLAVAARYRVAGRCAARV